MSLEDFSKAELEKIAEEFALDTEGLSEDELRTEVAKLSTAEVELSFPQWADRLQEDDEEEDDEESALVTSESTPKKGTAKKAAAKKTAAKKAATPAKAATSKTVVPDDRTLVKMTRNNPVYEVRGYRFTRQMPYVFVKNADVDFLIEVEGGFSVAKPSEVESFFA